MGIYKKLWDRSLDGENHEKRSAARFYLGATIVFLIALMTGSDNIFGLVKTRITIASQNRRIRQIRSSTNGIRYRVNTLRSDRDSLEKYAREEFDFCAPGEDVYLLSD